MILRRIKSKNVHSDLNDLFTPEVKLHIQYFPIVPFTYQDSICFLLLCFGDTVSAVDMSALSSKN